MILYDALSYKLNMENLTLLKLHMNLETGAAKAVNFVCPLLAYKVRC